MSQACAGATTLAQLLEENQILADKARSLEAKCHRLSVSSNSLQMENRQLRQLVPGEPHTTAAHLKQRLFYT